MDSYYKPLTPEELEAAINKLFHEAWRKNHAAIELITKNVQKQLAERKLGLWQG
ncbi:10323_t:CDS:2 [Paraglomus occultum]|uniref:10323_t:CDS:1 n=1 Tax=Paraglomus occultum TaxID=144539 RepID=A0A9N9GRL0_9GLOM|nr:10323_t:CDS:2 [Paraglomus occultum]